MSGDDGEITDRRVLRGIRNREAVVEAVIELIDEGELSPTATQIAERAGLALRSIYHHFDDLDDVSRAVADSLFGRFAELIEPIPSSGPFEVRLQSFVKQRSRIAERAMPIYRATYLVAPKSPALAERLAFAAAYLRGELAGTFQLELAEQAPWRLEGLDSLTSLNGWTRLRVNQRLSVTRSKEVLRMSIAALLDQELD